MKLENEGKFLCFKAKLEGGRFVYCIDRSINRATKKLEKNLVENVVSLEYIGEAVL